MEAIGNLIELAVNHIDTIATAIAFIIGFQLAYKLFRSLLSDYKRRNTVEFKHKDAPESITISVKGSKEDAKKLVDYVNRYHHSTPA
ncbi:hypothetical protein [Spirosoma sp.]|uniref:hypothetical protein n=1 Tax=Spirosoma sp. TaxID=1899569 RepID=UPI002611D781|nr:hypothetical protein [Spirosoma sp.]MCX6218349.1 hypothetical protein [Spirosoma sp.]